MRAREITLLLILGTVFWIAGTLYYEKRGPLIFETTALRYWSNFILTPIVTSGLCVLILRGLDTPVSGWASAMLLIALPGMVGEALLLSHFSTLMPRMQAASGGRYAAFLFATYAVTLGIAEMATLRAPR